MNKYKNRNGKSKIFIDTELEAFTNITIQIILGNIDVLYPQTNRSNPTVLICLNPNKNIPYGRTFINQTQWNEILKPVIEEVSPLLGIVPPTSSRKSIGKLYSHDDTEFIELVKNKISMRSKSSGYGT